MKFNTHTFTLFLILLILSCNESKQNTEETYKKKKDSITEKKLSQKTDKNNQKNKKGKKEISEEKLYGNWIYEGYIDHLNKTHSPYKSQSVIKNISEFYFPENKEDSVLIIYNNHEGEYKTFSIGNDRKISIGNGELMLKINELSKSRSLTLLKPNSKNQNFIYIPVEKDKRLRAINYLVNKLLISGTYKIKKGENHAENNKVIFNNQGFIKGLKKFKYFNVLTDFDDISDFDVLQLKKEKDSKGTWFGWEKGDKTLTIYHLKKAEGYQYDKDKVFIKLQKIQQKNL